MSCGQKAWAEELEEANYTAKLEKLKAIQTSKIVSTLERIKDDLELLISSDPSLTRGQWGRLDDALKELKTLI
jgi:hypothetical protein